MRRFTVTLAVALVILVAPVAFAQTPAPSGALMSLTLSDLPTDAPAMIGFVRTSIDVDGSLRMVSGSVPSVSFVENGSVSLQIVEGEQPPIIVRARMTGEAATPADAASMDLAPGDAFALPPETTVELANTSADTADLLDFISAPDASTESETGITRTVVVSRKVTLPAPSVSVSLERVTLEPGDRLTLPEAPAITAYAAVVQEEVFLLSGQGINRSESPLDAWVLIISPATSPKSTP